jgi:pilus assembly protein CpaE
MEAKEQDGQARGEQGVSQAQRGEKDPAVERRGRRILLVSKDEALQERVGSALEGKGEYALLRCSEDPGDALVLVSQTNLDLILLDRRMPGEEALRMVRELGQQVPEVPVVVLAEPADVDWIRRALLSGARAFLPLEFAPGSLLQTIEDLCGRLREAPGKRAPGRTVVVVGLKGGLGRSLVASNLALGLHELSKERVALVDGQLLYGDAEILLNLTPQHSIADLIDHAGSLDPELLDEALARHASGVRVLAASNNASAMARLRAEHVQSILSGLRAQYAWTVVDTGNWLDEWLGAFLRAADLVLLVTTPELTALRAARVFLQTARELGCPRERIRLVINRANLVGAIPQREIERNLSMEAYATLPDDSALATYSINRGVPLVVSHPRKPLARALKKLAGQLVQELAPQPVARRGRRLL